MKNNVRELKQRKRENTKKWRDCHRERYRELGRNWYWRHREEIKEKRRLFKLSHPITEEQRIKNKEYRDKNRDYLRGYLRDYNKNVRNRDRVRQQGKESRTRTKYEVLSHYGNGKCACIRCGFEDIRALTIDHINGDGHIERAKYKNKCLGYSLYVRLRRESYPLGYQTLCSNCQRIKQVEQNEWRKVEKVLIQ